MFKKLLLSLGCAMAVTSGSANAALIYNEAVSGDSGFWAVNPVLLGAVKSGDYVLGRVSNPAGAPDWEGYKFILDGSVRQINIAALSGPVSNGWQLHDTVRGVMPRSGQLDDGHPLLSFDVTGFTGTYMLGNNGLNTSRPYDYEISFDTALQADVPEPASLALLGLGLAGLCARRRRKTS